jgi:prefoldin subunit 5
MSIDHEARQEIRFLKSDVDALQDRVRELQSAIKNLLEVHPQVQYDLEEETGLVVEHFS